MRVMVNKMQTKELKIEFHTVKAGFVSLVPISLFVLVFGAAFGLAASQEGLNQTSAVLMSTIVFAGAAQFGVLELWGTQVPVVPLVLTVFAINARHLLIGATLYPYIQHLKPASRYGVMLVASDANWAISMRAFTLNNSSKGVGLLLGGGIALWLFWVIGTWIGFYFGHTINNPSVYGVDMVMACFLLTMVLQGERENKTYLIWLGAAVSSILAYLYLPENTHIMVGALTGGVIGVLLGDKK